MQTVAQILKVKGATVHTVTPDTLLDKALQFMSEHNVGTLVVTDEGRLVGIFSERDLARKIDADRTYPLQVPVGHLMSRDVFCVGEEKTLDECMALVTRQRCRHLPVMRGRQLVGLVSIGDLVKAALAEKDFAIDQLCDYIRAAS